MSIYFFYLSASFFFFLLLSPLGFLNLLSACLQHVCDRAAWQEGRQADGHWDLEWFRSGAGGAHGERVFPTSVECQRTPLQCFDRQRNSPTKSTFTHWERVTAFCVRACRARKKGFAIIRNNTLGFFGREHWGQPAFHSPCISKHRC